MPPAADTWAPKSMPRRYCRRERPRPHGSVADGVPPHRRRAHLPLQLALRSRGAAASASCESRTRTRAGRSRSRRCIERSLRLARHRVGRRDDVPARGHGAREAGGRQARRRGHGLRGRGRDPDPHAGRWTTGWDDAIKGRIEVPNAELEDVVLVRSDGRPTYNFASPLEDWLDGITHVIRGDDHVSNTPKQVNVLRALAPSRPSTHTCRMSSARTARSSRNATVPCPSTSSGSRATYPRR